jgi:hypothetical protein
MEITAVNSDVNGIEFIASAQGKKYPVFYQFIKIAYKFRS